jgi:hypothetical protein
MTLHDLAVTQRDLSHVLARVAAAMELRDVCTAPPPDVPRGADHEQIAVECMQALQLCRLAGVPTPLECSEPNLTGATP